jgi:hypothetical protein
MVHVKKAQSAYFWFLAERRAAVKEQNPGIVYVRSYFYVLYSVDLAYLKDLASAVSKRSSPWSGRTLLRKRKR